MPKPKAAPEQTYKTVLRDIPIEQLIPADWNYKDPLSLDERERLRASIVEDGSSGVHAVRFLPDRNVWEMMDGNHRLEELIELGFKVVRCEDFGAITKAQAISIAHRRNSEWAPTDYTKLSRLINDEILPTMSLESLAKIFPEDAKRLPELIALGNFNWESLPGDKIRQEGEAALRFPISADVLLLWNQFKAYAVSRWACQDENAVLKVLLERATKGLKLE